MTNNRSFTKTESAIRRKAMRRDLRLCKQRGIAANWSGPTYYVVNSYNIVVDEGTLARCNAYIDRQRILA